jgi:peptidoglycan/xylan/chitin deacetylase (PgdA/CDA1 family)
MFLINPLKGDSLPEYTLCLTYDDGPGETIGAGPGPRTLEIAKFLADHGVQATFFMCGKNAEKFLRLLSPIQNYGHLIGNHTYHHPNLARHLSLNGDVIEQITRTESLIRNNITGNTIYFRPPYLQWSAEVAETLNESLIATLSHVGPIHADLDTRDWAFWRDDKHPNECVESFLSTVGQKKRGIVLMHDSASDIAVNKQKWMTYQLTEILVPRLLEMGYRFVRLDKIPAIIAAAKIPLVCGLRGSNGRYISPQHGGGGKILVNGPEFDAWEHVTVEYLGPSKVALRAANGLYFTPLGGGGGEVAADGPSVAAWQPLDVIPVGASRVAFRTVTGHFLTRENSKGGRLLATESRLREWEVFLFENHSNLYF